MRPIKYLVASLLLTSSMCAVHAQDAQHCPSGGTLLHREWGKTYVAGENELGDCSFANEASYLQALKNQARGHKVQPTTLPITEFSQGHRLVHVSGVLLGEGQPVPNSAVNVIVDLDGNFSAFQQVRTDGRGVWNVWIQAPAPIRAIHADSPSFWVDADGQRDDTVDGDGPDGFNLLIGMGAE